nr:MAG TPA: hypothetical protein [Caudoviricetes sp.]
MHAVIEDRTLYFVELVRCKPGQDVFGILCKHVRVEVDRIPDIVRANDEPPCKRCIVPVKKIVRVNAQLWHSHAGSPPCRSDRSVRGDGLDRDAVQILGKQGHAGDGKAFGHGGGVVALRMEADQVACLACGGVHQTGLCVVAVGGVNIVHHDVVHGGGNDLALCDLAVRQQEDGVVAHEVLDVLEAVLVLDGDVCGAQILGHVQNVCKAHNAGDGAVHVLKLVLHAALCHRQSHLEGLGRALQAAGVQVLVELVSDLGGQVVQELVIGLLDSNLVSVILDSLKGDGLCVLLDGDLAVVLLLDGVLAVGDLLALCHGAALQGALCILALQHGAGLHTDGAHDAHDLPQMIPVALEAGHEVDLAGVDGDLGGGNQIFFCCHSLFLPAACEQVGICCNRCLTLARVLDCKNLVFGHFGAGVCGRVVHRCALGGGAAHIIAPIGFQALSQLVRVLHIALAVQFHLVDVLARQAHDAVKVLFQHACGFKLLPELCFLGCMGVLLGLLVLVIGQRLLCGLLTAVGCVPFLFRCNAGVFLGIQLVPESIGLLVQGVQNGFCLVIVGGFGVFQNLADICSFECHVCVLSALAWAAMLGNKV